MNREIGTLIKLGLTVLVILLIVNVCFWPQSKDVRVGVPGPDGRRYMVRASPRQSESAAALARLNARVSILIHKLQMSDHEPKMKQVVDRIASRYNPDVISEGVIDNDKTSYTVNKGEEVVYCLRSRDDKDELYSDNKLMHVAVHELAHIGSLASGADSHYHDFPVNLHYLETKAAEYGLISPITESWEYCGIQV